VLKYILPVGGEVLFLCAKIQLLRIPVPIREATWPKGQILQGGADMRVKVTLRCNECKQRNYNTFKNKKNTPDRLEMSKYCPFCRKHTTHSETK